MVYYKKKTKFNKIKNRYMGRPKMVQSMDSVYTYTEMQDTIVTHFGLWDGGNIDSSC